MLPALAGSPTSPRLVGARRQVDPDFEDALPAAPEDALAVGLRLWPFRRGTEERHVEEPGQAVGDVATIRPGGCGWSRPAATIATSRVNPSAAGRCGSSWNRIKP